MDRFELAKVVMEKIEAYAATCPDKDALTMEGFQHMLFENTDIHELKNNFITHDTRQSQYHEMNVERVIAQHLTFMYRYVKHYAKMIFQDSALKSLEEFSFMTTVMQYNAISKSDLIRKNVYEKSSGIEIINRLIKLNFFMQEENPNDIRSKLILLTEQGRAELYRIFGKMNTLGIIASGELTYAEKIMLANILKKLDNFHYHNYNQKSMQQLDDYLPDSFKALKSTTDYGQQH